MNNRFFSKFKFHHIYFILAGFDILMLLVSMILNHQNLLLFTTSVNENQYFLKKMNDVEILSKLASETNAPGNNVFDTQNVSEERKNFEKALKKFNDHFSSINTDSELAQFYSNINKSMDAMVTEANLIFSSFDKGDKAFAGSRMATMDQKYAHLNENLSTLRNQIGTLQSNSLTHQNNKAQNLSVIETATGIIILLIVGIVTYFGHRLGTLLRSKDEIINQQEFQILDSQKLSNLGAMSSAIVHEILNPLTIISGKATSIDRILSHENIQNLKITEHLQDISKMVERITIITKGIKNLAHSGDNVQSFEKVNFSDLLKETVALGSVKTKENNVSLRVGTLKSLEVECNPVQLSQVLLNLISNACDAIHGQEKPWIQLDFLITETILQISVTDSGHGIKPEVAEKLMSPFFTTKERGKGTGLGLSISHNIIKEHKGTLKYNPHFPNTQFIITLPIKSEESSISTKAA